MPRRCRRSSIAAIRAGDVDLTDPAATIALLRLNAVVGVIGKVDDLGQLTSVGITCALCHSTVDNSFTTGIGKRLDGWPNRDLNVGAILGLSPLLDDPGWGPGRYDPRHQVFDGQNVVTRYDDHGASPDPARLWAQGRRIRDLHRRRTDFLLEQLRRCVADGRQGQLQRSRASGSSSPSSRIASRRNCPPCASISSVSARRLPRPEASMLPQPVAANVCSTAKPTARGVTRRRRTPTC